MDGALYVDHVSNQRYRWHSSWRKEFITSVWILLYQNRQPCSLDVHCKLHGPYASHFACTSGRRKGRGTSFGTTTSFSLSCFTSSTLSKLSLDCCICPNSVWIIFGSQDSMDRSAAKPAVLYALSSPALYPVQLSWTAVKNMAPAIDPATPSIHIYVVLSYRLNLFM